MTFEGVETARRQGLVVVTDGKDARANAPTSDTASSEFARRASRVRADLPLVVIDALAVAGSYLACLVLRFDGSVPERFWTPFRWFIVTALMVHLGANWACCLYRQMWRHASVAEARRVVLSSVTATSALVVSVSVHGRAIPRSVVVLGGVLCMFTIGAVRFQSRLFAFSRTRCQATIRVVVVGARDAGAALIREMLRSPGAGLLPVAVVDDDEGGRPMSLAGVPLEGGIADLASIVRRTRAAQVVLAIPAAPPELAQRVFAQAAAASVPVKVVPGVRERVGGCASVRDVRDLRIEDLLGRPEVVTDLDGVRELLRGRRVLITGAGGSIGSEISRQVAACNPGALILLDHDETHLFNAAAVITPSPVSFLADIRDRNVMDEVMRQYRPEIVFHAAAHKHVPMLELHPCEAVLTNVVGTSNVIDAAVEHGVERFVFISTDKAVQPASVMGATKRLGEQMVVAKAPPGSRYSAVRFGNVLGSRGSVIETFKRQIQDGGPVTVTDPNMARFFMSVQEAVQLVLQAAAIAEGGDVFMLDMGEEVLIKDLAEKMILLSGRTPGVDIEIRITGARDGEKLSEALVAPSERSLRTSHPAILRIVPRHRANVDFDRIGTALAALAGSRRSAEVRTALVDLVGGSGGMDFVPVEAS